MCSKTAKTQLLTISRTSERGCIDFPLKKSSYILKANLFIKPELLSKLTISINGNPLHCFMKRRTYNNDEYQWVDVEAPIHRSLIDKENKSRLMISIEDPLGSAHAILIMAVAVRIGFQFTVCEPFREKMSAFIFQIYCDLLAFFLNEHFF